MVEASAIKFPCDFPIKMMGLDTPEFHATARALIERHVGPIEDNAVRSALSSNGKYVSITVTIIATSQRQLDDIYRDVSAHEKVLMAL